MLLLVAVEGFFVAHYHSEAHQLCLLRCDLCSTAVMQGRDLYVIGAANVGKSAFVRSLMQEMGSMSSRHYDAAAAEHRRRLPVESPMPGTTLGPIALHAFASGGTLFGSARTLPVSSKPHCSSCVCIWPAPHLLVQFSAWT